MIAKNLPLLLLFWLQITLHAQDATDRSVWTEKPAFSDLKPGHEKENVVGIFMDEKYEFFYSADGNLQVMHSFHRKFRLNHDDAINSFNKFSVSLSNVIELVELKARVVKPGGQIIEFDKNNIKEVIDEKSGSNYKIFAIDGIERGDDIEYFFKRKMSGNNFGQTFFQFKYPMLRASYEIISPKNLIYAIKGYNGFPDGVHTVLPEERNQFKCEMENIPALTDEKYAYFNPRRARVDYRLDYNYNRGRSKVLTWNDASQRVYEMIYQDVNTKKVDSWIKSLRIKDGSSLSKAAQIEEYIKSNIFIQDFHLPEFSDFDYIRSKKVSSERGIVGLYANLFKSLGIKHEVVLTSERSNVRFDPDFQSWNYLDKYLIYLNDGDTYIDPASNNFRLGCVEGDLTATHGLFIEIVKLGAFESAVGKIKYIHPAPFKANYDNMNIEISVDVDKANTRVINTRGFKGLSGGYFSKIYKALDDDQKQRILKDLMETKAPNPVYNSLKVLQKSDIEFIKDAEFLIFCDFNSSSFIEIAGNKLLLNVGESIGPQVELYFENDRKVAAEYGHNRWYYRNIIVNIPEGYRIVNPEVVEIGRAHV